MWLWTPRRIPDVPCLALQDTGTNLQAESASVLGSCEPSELLRKGGQAQGTWSAVAVSRHGVVPRRSSQLAVLTAPSSPSGER